MKSLKQFDLKKFIIALEGLFHVYRVLDEYDVLFNVKHTEESITLTYEYCMKTKRMYEKIFKGLQEKGYIINYGVNMPATGIFRMWFVSHYNENETEFRTVNIY